MTTRAALHEAIDELPEGVLETLARALERLRDDPFQFMLDNAPMDDEPVTEAECAALDKARAQVAAGQVISNEEVTRLLEALR